MSFSGNASFTVNSNIAVLTGNQSNNEVKIMHTSNPTSPFGDGGSIPSSTARSFGSGGTEIHQQPFFQSSANPVLAETFERHWQQLRGIAAHNVRF